MSAPASNPIDDLSTEEFVAIGREVVQFVGAAQHHLASPGAAQSDLVGAGLSFLIDLIDPLQRCLDEVTGDAASLTAKANDWVSIAEQLRATGPEVHRLTGSAKAAWTGVAADSFDATMREFLPAADGAAAACDAIRSLLATSAELMAGAQGLIQDVIGEVVDYMIVVEASAAASALHGGGASEAVALSSILGRVSDAVEQALGIVDQVSDLLARIANALRNVSRAFGRVNDLLATLSKIGNGVAAGGKTPGRLGNTGQGARDPSGAGRTGE